MSANVSWETDGVHQLGGGSLDDLLRPAPVPWKSSLLSESASSTYSDTDLAARKLDLSRSYGTTKLDGNEYGRLDSSWLGMSKPTNELGLSISDLPSFQSNLALRRSDSKRDYAVPILNLGLSRTVSDQSAPDECLPTPALSSCSLPSQGEGISSDVRTARLSHMPSVSRTTSDSSNSSNASVQQYPQPSPSHYDMQTPLKDASSQRQHFAHGNSYDPDSPFNNTLPPQEHMRFLQTVKRDGLKSHLMGTGLDGGFLTSPLCFARNGNEAPQVPMTISQRAPSKLAQAVEPSSPIVSTSQEHNDESHADLPPAENRLDQYYRYQASRALSPSLDNAAPDRTEARRSVTPVHDDESRLIRPKGSKKRLRLTPSKSRLRPIEPIEQHALLMPDEHASMPMILSPSVRPLPVPVNSPTVDAHRARSMPIDLEELCNLGLGEGDFHRSPAQQLMSPPGDAAADPFFLEHSDHQLDHFLASPTVSVHSLFLSPSMSPSAQQGFSSFGSAAQDFFDSSKTPAVPAIPSQYLSSAQPIVQIDYPSERPKGRSVSLAPPEKPRQVQRKRSHIDMEQAQAQQQRAVSEEVTLLSPSTLARRVISGATYRRLKPGPKPKRSISSNGVVYPPCEPRGSTSPLPAAEVTLNPVVVLAGGETAVLDMTPLPDEENEDTGPPGSSLPRSVIESLYKTVSIKVNDTRGEKEERRYVCLVDGCEREFPRRGAIASHIQTHLEDKPFVCSVGDCKSSFVRSHDLKRHERIHSDVKSFLCPCGKGFARGDALQRHRVRGICVGSIVPLKRAL
ncbi:uncharacterized protein L969DRAFT_54671 [Mixia osmundae IAM 14324]|uniref:C2H2-type domain-containing protein n=1 Tax=Mixia osmundae (strain CBS 9802 / IAM 14324 / JCM 22182 / KY 12970) TaxID=764103 RepID=G7E1S9_MIXOS|nr:uncharacterized protein L969DRAFT_54671 [Mixia osmundae IAM 14324]KEI36738.1 hypothetical protein L969DRAFT_54671 [Mixia osmundae IAM 14324]GAA96789.1 hypothetical protein E5Q_03460 [Mixia osmundae IAM 14324]